MSSAKTDIQSKEHIVRLVNLFYNKVRSDSLLAAVFAHVDWPAHLPTMYAFWSSLLLGDRSYEGNPMQKHLRLPIHEAHFDRWIELFSQTLGEEFEGPKATEALERARGIAQLMRHRMGLSV